MLIRCEVLELFNTSLGKVAVLGFIEIDTIPYIGMVLTNNNNHWKISGIGMNKTIDLKARFGRSDIISIWDCKLENINHEYELKTGEILYKENKDG